MLSHALAYAKRGWAICPIWWPSEPGLCACPAGHNCNSPAKHPITRNGIKDATTNETIIRSWWAKNPFANIALHCGINAGVMVVDVDPRNGGMESIKSIGQLLRTPTALTGGGGWHLFYKYSDGFNNAKSIRPGIDIKTTGGYVLLAPSMHASGDRYQWSKDRGLGKIKLSEIDPKIFEMVKDKAERNIYRPRKIYDLDKPSPAKDFMRSMPAIANGSRNDTIFRCACSLRASQLPDAEVMDRIHALNRAKCSPPLPDREVDLILRSALRYR